LGFEVFANAFAERLRLEVFGAGDGVLGDAGVAVRVRQVLFDEAGDFVGAVVEEDVVFVAKAVAQADVVARVGGDEDGPAGGIDYVLATPKHSNAGYQYIRLGFKGDDLAEMRLKDSFGNQTTIKFNNLNTRSNLSRSQFRFTPPQGVDVLTQ